MLAAGARPFFYMLALCCWPFGPMWLPVLSSALLNFTYMGMEEILGVHGDHSQQYLLANETWLLVVETVCLLTGNCGREAGCQGLLSTGQ